MIASVIENKEIKLRWIKLSFASKFNFLKMQISFSIMCCQWKILFRL